MGSRSISAAAAVTACLVTATAFGTTAISQAADAAPSGQRAERPDAPSRAAHIPVEAALVSRARVRDEAKLRDAQAAQFYAAVVEYFRPKTGVNWDAIARCETGGNWSMRGSQFSGGLGFYNGTWTAFGGREFASNAGYATRDQQIVVAERVVPPLRPLRLGLSPLRVTRPGRHPRSRSVGPSRPHRLTSPTSRSATRHPGWSSPTT